MIRPMIWHFIVTPAVAVFTACFLTLEPISAHAQVQFYNSLSGFQSAAPAATVKATFESYSLGQINDFSEGGLSFANNGGGPLYILTPASGGTTPNPVSNILTANDNERFDITFSSANPTAVGFDTYTNNFSAPVVNVYDISNALLGSYTLTQGASTLGYFGVTSPVPIGRVLWIATGGQAQNTAIDNVRTGIAGSAAAPEPGSVVLIVLSGAPVLGRISRRRCKAA